MNNKGQVLVMFVIFIPIFLIILVLLIDISNLFLTNNEINDISYTVLEYGLDNIDKNNVITTSKELFLANKKEASIDLLEIKDNKIYLNVSYHVKGIISDIVDIKAFDINNKYVAYIDGDKKIIERIK